MERIPSLISADLDAHIRAQIARWTVPGLSVVVLRDGERGRSVPRRANRDPS